MGRWDHGGLIKSEELCDLEGFFLGSCLLARQKPGLRSSVRLIERWSQMRLPLAAPQAALWEEFREVEMAFDRT